MATKKKEIYARAAVQLRTHERAIKAERRCPGAMGLYLFLLLDSRGEQTHGDVDEEVALTSWAGTEKYRAKQIEALVAVGLVDRVDGRLHVVKYDEHNDTPKDIEDARLRARERMYSVRQRKACSPDVQRTSSEHTPSVPITDADVPISSSISISESGSGSEIARARPDPSASPVPWWGAVLATVGMQTGVDLPAGEAWLRYAGHRAGKGLPATREDALYWLTTVMVPEARKTIGEAARQRERDAKYDKLRAGPGSTTTPIVDTPEEQAERAARLERQTRERKARERGAA